MDTIDTLANIEVNKVQEVIDDLELENKGAKIYLVIDPHEVFDFCFPINPEGKQPQNSVDIDKIADDQIAFWDVFFSREELPILPPEYFKETDGILRYFQNTANESYSLLDTFLSNLSEDFEFKASEGTSIKNNVYQLQKLTEEKFNRILGIAMGLNSLGAKRFHEIVTSRLDVDYKTKKNDHIAAVYEQYRKTALADSIFKFLKNNIDKANTANPDRMPYETLRELRAAQNDANAIDRLIYLNRELSKLYYDKKIPERIIFLYLSSAHKTERIFNNSIVKKAMEGIVRGRSYSIWRTRTQIFLGVVQRTQKGDKTDIQETIEKLKFSKGVLQNIYKVAPEKQCGNCILRGGSPPQCESASLCSDVNIIKTPIDQRRRIEKNLGLVEKIDNFRKILSKSKLNQNSSDHQKFLHSLLVEIFKYGNKNNWATTRRRDLKSMISAKSKFVKLLISPMEDEPLFLRSKRDAVTCTAQYLPKIKLLKLTKLSDKTYDSFINKANDYFSTAPLGGAGKKHELGSIYNRFLELDETVDDLSAIHELTRCLLFLMFPDPEGDKRAFDICRIMIDASNEVPQEIIAEFFYIASCAGRRSLQFQLTYSLIEKGINLFPRDPRLFHGKSLNIYSWIYFNSEDCPFDLSDCRNEAKKAADLYLDDPIENREALGATYNNLSYWYSLETLNLEENLFESREALKNLKKVVPRQEWTPLYPEYYHTEAHLEYKEFLFFSIKGEKEEKLLEKLGHANKACKTAIALNPLKQIYRILENNIDMAISKFSKWQFKTNPGD